MEKLSKRELEVVKLIADGLNYQRIADLLVISISTVKAHMNSIFQKLELNDRAEVVAYAWKNGLTLNQKA